MDKKTRKAQSAVDFLLFIGSSDIGTFSSHVSGDTTAIGGCRSHEGAYSVQNGVWMGCVCVKWHPHECLGQKFPSMTLHLSEEINVIHI